MALHVSDISGLEDFRNAGTGLPGISAVCAGMFRNVRNGGVARRLAQESEMKRERIIRAALLYILASYFAAALLAVPARAEGITLPPEVLRAMDKIYGGDPD